ncbi:DtxR family iron (metal) dependent repressor [Natranaerovirga pectinivora]|uniref:Manganese transport regulator n=1 Tax=Natranaerovirga pectinivora TaxID=682400 RepID=A0A4R3MM69_9FIRM|nr:transcriptional regulator MntR [Natranaerovirga pectinivora]TCT14935.1 DtxR family iron (metal) dependent repressor [Natranaerovirga pectinivora]
MKNNYEEFHTARGYEIANIEEDLLSASMEDYLEMIYRLSRDIGYVRVNDLADKLNVQPPSVTKMVQKLNKKSVLRYERYGVISLTEKGLKLGKFFYERHNTVKEFLNLIQANDNLQKDVEMMEHCISFNTYKVISALVNFMKADSEFLKRFNDYSKLYLKK